MMGYISPEYSNHGVLTLLGTMQRMKWGSLELNVVNKASSWTDDTFFKVFRPASFNSFPYPFSFLPPVGRVGL